VTAIRRRRALAARGIALAVLALVAPLSACAPERDATWSPASWAETGGVVADEPAPQPAPDAVALVPQRIRNDATGVDARWSYLPGTHAVNDAVESVVRAAIDAQVAVSGVAYTPQVHDRSAGLDRRGCESGATSAPAPDLLGAGAQTRTVVVCEIVHAAGTVLVQRLRTVRGSASGIEADDVTTIFTDVSTGQVGTGAALVADAAAVWEPLIETLRRTAGALSLVQIAPPTPDQLAALTAALGDAYLGADEVILTLPAGFTTPELAGLSAWRTPDAQHPVRVALPISAVEPLLTDLGRAIRSSSGAFAGPLSAGAAFDRTPCDLVPCMALTLDDGPGALTAGILDVLRERDSAATFYMLGQNAQRNPNTVRRVAAEGHQIGNHSWNHPYLVELTDAQIRAQLEDTGDVLRALSGQSVATFRPPGGRIDDRVLAVAGMPAVMWGVDTRDWAGPEDGALAALAIDSPRIGTIMLMHDIQAVTGRVLAEVVDGLRARGFSLVTIDALFGGAVPAGIVRHGP
jgi:peptidoglycan/xylan/chitin deacetylase (PgdA/CDA1 family)